MLNEKIAKLLNTQINKEFYSAYLYLHFANFYVEQGLNGFANWYQIQAQEERDHALLMLQYLQNNDAKVALEAIAQPDAVLKENMDPLKAVKEQGEEEKNAADLIKKMELFGSEKKGLYMLDQELAARVYAAPSLTL